MTAPPSEPCVVCASTRLRTEFDAVEPGFSVVRCRDCGLGRTWPPVPDAEIGRWYEETYYGKENVRFNPVMEAMTRLFRRQRARVIDRRVPRGPVLDVGCGRGFLLGSLRELGYQPVGVEISETAAWHARNRLGLEVITGDFVTARFERGPFHAIVFWHSLEHLPRPVPAIARAAELLRPGGLLMVAVPNSDSFQGRSFGRSWFHLDVPRHYFHFGTRSLSALLARHGLRVVEVDHVTLEQNPYGWLQSLYNALGFRFNLLYSILKTPSARTVSLRAHPVQVLAVLALLPVFLCASLAMTALETIFRRGGTIVAYAVKE